MPTDHQDPVGHDARCLHPKDTPEGQSLRPADRIVGRVIFKAEQNFTVTGASQNQLGLYAITVYDPKADEYIVFVSLDLFENWAYGKPVSCAY